MTRLDYCNSLLCGMPDYVLNKLQGVQNTLARVVTRSNAPTPAAPVFSKTPLVADPPKNLLQTGNADLQSPSCFHFHPTTPVKSTFRSKKYWHSLRSVDRPLLSVPRTRTSTTLWRFSCSGSL